MDSVTGEFSWREDFPLGTYDFSITTKSREATTTVKIVLTNRFFSGGFRLNEDRSTSLQKYSNPVFLTSGNWSISEDYNLSIAFISNLSGRETTFMTGSLSFSYDSKLLLFIGEYGSALNKNQEIENPTEIFW